MEAVHPIHPDEQLKMLKNTVEYEQQQIVRIEDIRRIQYYLTKVITINFLYFPRKRLTRGVCELWITNFNKVFL